MAMKENFADQLKAQSEVWRAQVKDYQERLDQMGEQARSDYKKAMEQMETQAEEARKLAERCQPSQSYFDQRRLAGVAPARGFQRREAPAMSTPNCPKM
jgi:hypothetical protein